MLPYHDNFLFLLNNTPNIKIDNKNIEINILAGEYNRYDMFNRNNDNNNGIENKDNIVICVTANGVDARSSTRNKNINNAIP
ncbi:MAG: hypothetical protein QXV17_04900 [Candidatus Micrarchaeaceae archaeon]